MAIESSTLGMSPFRRITTLLRTPAPSPEPWPIPGGAVANKTCGSTSARYPTGARAADAEIAASSPAFAIEGRPADAVTSIAASERAGRPAR